MVQTLDETGGGGAPTVERVPRALRQVAVPVGPRVERMLLKTPNRIRDLVGTARIVGIKEGKVRLAVDWRMVPEIAQEEREAVERQQFLDYLRRVGFGRYIEHVPQMSLNTIVEDTYREELPRLTPDQIDQLYTVLTPHVRADEVASCVTPPPGDAGHEEGEHREQLVSCDLRQLLNLPTDPAILQDHDMTRLLQRMAIIMERAQREIGSGWIGIYLVFTLQSGERVAVKLASCGKKTAMVFPTDAAFAAQSNNTTVLLTGRAVVIEDKSTWEGPDYVCDPEVLAEVDLPVDPIEGEKPGEIEMVDGRALIKATGNVDAEDPTPGFYTPDRVVQLAWICYQLPRREPQFRRAA